jgi:hypothetical protein
MLAPEVQLCFRIQVLERKLGEIDWYSEGSCLLAFRGFTGRIAGLSTFGGFIRYKRKKRYIWRRWWYLTLVKVKVEEK